MEDEEDEEGGDGSNIVKKKGRSGIFCDVWVAPVRQYSGEEIKQWASRFGHVESVAKEGGKTFAIIRFGEERSADWCMKIQRLKNMRSKKREREEVRMDKIEDSAVRPAEGTSTYPRTQPSSLLASLVTEK